MISKCVMTEGDVYIARNEWIYRCVRLYDYVYRCLWVCGIVWMWDRCEWTHLSVWIKKYKSMNRYLKSQWKII